MLSFSLIYEDAVLRKDVGGGIGGNFGRYGGALVGGLLGTAIGLGNSNISDLDNFDPDTADPKDIAKIVGGAYLGTGLGTALGGQIGRSIGQASISNPDKPADFTKISHRIGHLANPNTKWYGAISDIVLPGSGGAIGAIRNATSDDGAKKVGYGNVGRMAQILSVPTGFFDYAPLMGITDPEKKVKNK